MLEFLVNNFMVLAETLPDCNYLLGNKNDPNSLYSLLQYAFTAIKVAAPLLVIVLCTVDIVSAVASQEEKNMRACLSKSIKRIIAGVVIFFIPMLINLIIDLVDLTGTCGIE